ncbi:DegT/DnrJ/EryC1/StrS aminotransferase family protein [Candidatus Woesearchaeota archaeon]|nr:MAG: DegT/DnrJ/EryC1/StrS aminotransferase family protein [Candidatus Woesearchaeota archaeon]
MTFTIPLIKPHISERDITRVVEVLKTGYLTEGAVTRAFEQAVATYVGVDEAVAFTSWTTGAETVLRALGIGPGDEVIVPDYTHPATVEVVMLVGATPVLVDCDPSTANIDYTTLETACTEKTKAILPVSLFGNPLDYTLLNKLKERFGFLIIEDAACSLGATFHGKAVGSLADVSIFSLHPRKFITTGEGGMVTTNDKCLAAFLRSYKNFGMEGATARRSSQFVRVGTNYKMSDILAALGLSQMERIEELLSRRRQLAERYRTLLRGLPGVSLPIIASGAESSWQSFTIRLAKRDHVLTTLRSQGIEVQIGTFALHEQPAFKHLRRASSLAGSSRLFNECLSLPLYHSMTLDEQERVVTALKKALANEGDS